MRLECREDVDLNGAHMGGAVRKGKVRPGPDTQLKTWIKRTRCHFESMLQPKFELFTPHKRLLVRPHAHQAQSTASGGWIATPLPR